jgi:hypothetical protein
MEGSIRLEAGKFGEQVRRKMMDVVLTAWVGSLPTRCS